MMCKYLIKYLYAIIIDRIFGQHQQDSMCKNHKGVWQKTTSLLDLRLTNRERRYDHRCGPLRVTMAAFMRKSS